MHDNVVANMYGPYFLAFYALVIVTALLAARLWQHLQDESRHMAAPTIPDEVDPYEVAFLGGGVKRLKQAIVVSLSERGYLRNVAGTIMQQSEEAPSPEHLSSQEKEVFDFFELHRESNAIDDELVLDGSSYEARLNDSHLLATDELRRTAVSANLLALLLILGLGSYKLFVALAAGRTNVLFLILLGLIGTATAVWRLHPRGDVRKHRRRLTARGRALVKRLELAHEGAKYNIEGETSSLPLLVGLYGVTALTGAHIEDYQSFFSPRSSGGGGFGGGYGGGCGAGCGGGGGCGGGCGGCGGCGG